MFIWLLLTSRHQRCRNINGLQSIVWAKKSKLRDSLAKNCNIDIRVAGHSLYAINNLSENVLRNFFRKFQRMLPTFFSFWPNWTKITISILNVFITTILCSDFAFRFFCFYDAINYWRPLRPRVKQANHNAKCGEMCLLKEVNHLARSLIVSL